MNRYEILNRCFAKGARRVHGVVEGQPHSLCGVSVVCLVPTSESALDWRGPRGCRGCLRVWDRLGRMRRYLERHGIDS